MEAYRAGVQYHLVHSVALLALGLHQERGGQSAAGPAQLMLWGLLLFSGSLYALTLTGVTAFGYLTPFGGMLLIAAWVQIARTSKWS
jgi:uncharacterized membrane protein YgdD (TMEM256/DUF423 family)